MSRLNTKAEIVRHIGNSNVAAPRNRFFVYPFNFNNVAPSGEAEVNQKFDTTNDFVVDYLVGDLWLAGAGAIPPTAVAGTPLHRSSDPSPAATVGNQLPSMSHTAVEIFVNDGPWFNAPVRTSLLFGVAIAPLVTLFQPVVGAGITVRMKLYNYSAAAISGQLCFVGHLVGS